VRGFLGIPDLELPSGGSVVTFDQATGRAKWTPIPWGAPGAIGSTTPSTGAFTTLSVSGVITSTLATGTAPFTVASTTVCPNLNAALLNGTTWTAPGAIGGGTPSTGAFTTLSATGVITSTLATGTAPFTVASTTVVGNLNVSQLLGSTWAIPGSIGSTTPNAGAFTTLSTTGALTVALQAAIGSNAAASSTLNFNTAASNQRGFQFQSAGVNLWQIVTGNTESGSDAGCNLQYVARSDAGSIIDVPLQLNRAAGTAVQLGRPLKLANAYVGGAPTATGYVTVQDSSGTTYKILVST
jgi:hypothetical protein